MNLVQKMGTKFTKIDVWGGAQQKPFERTRWMCAPPHLKKWNCSPSAKRQISSLKFRWWETAVIMRDFGVAYLSYKLCSELSRRVMVWVTWFRAWVFQLNKMLDLLPSVSAGKEESVKSVKSVTVAKCTEKWFAPTFLSKVAKSLV